MGPSPQPLVYWEAELEQSFHPSSATFLSHALEMRMVNCICGKPGSEPLDLVQLLAIRSLKDEQRQADSHLPSPLLIIS
jgi:hypothetical protein